MAAEYQKIKPSRLAFLAICFAVMAIVLFTRLVYWQVLRRGDVRTLGGTASGETNAASWRGSIYDSHGHFLAVPSVIYDVGASPRTITEPERVAAELSPLLNVPVPTLVPELKQTSVAYVPLARNIAALNGQAIKDLAEPGIKLDVSPGRYYPEGNLAAAVLGFVNSEQHAFYGVEEYYDSRLRGSAGVDAAGQPQSGVDLVLTIDRVIQHFTEQYLEKALKDYGAKGGEIIVMDPATGAILGMAVAPSYDPNNYTQVPNQEVWTNGAISKGYEPGSVFKIVTMAAGLDAGTTKPDDTYDDTGRITVGGKPIENWDKKAHGITNMREVLAYSLNLGSVHVAMELGSDKFYDALRRFGFGEVTGIDLAGEVPGSMRVPGSTYWSMTDLATNSFGQGLSVTPIQMISAVAAVANHGLLMKPYAVSSMVKNGQVVWQATPQAVRQVIKPEVADELTDMLIWAMPEETPLAVVPGYTSAGKTGTAQVAEKGGYGDKVIVSFAGYLPAKNPRFAVLVKLDEPTRSAWGSQAAAPVWRSVATDLCTYLGVPPDGAKVAR